MSGIKEQGYSKKDGEASSSMHFCTFFATLYTLSQPLLQVQVHTLYVCTYLSSPPNSRRHQQHQHRINTRSILQLTIVIIKTFLINPNTSPQHTTTSLSQSITAHSHNNKRQQHPATPRHHNITASRHHHSHTHTLSLSLPHSSIHTCR
jgi:hypothetical protein